MKPSLGLAALVARRFLSPTGLFLIGGALALAVTMPWSPSAVRGGAELSLEVSAGLARQGVWICALGMILPWFAWRSSTFVRQWRQGESDWLGTSALSRAGVAWSHVIGALFALGIALVPFAIAGEVRSRRTSPQLEWLADGAVRSVVLMTENDRVSLDVDPPAAASLAIARFVVAAPGNGGPSATVRCTLERAGSATIRSEARISNTTSLRLELRGGTGPLKLTFEPVGPGAVVVLEGPRLQWFAPHPARWSVAVSLLLHAWLAAAACAAIALGVAAWTSPGTAFLFAAAVPAIAGLEDRASVFWPGVGLRDALELAGAGFGPGYPALSAWIGCAVALCAAPCLQALARDLWRREP